MPAKGKHHHLSHHHQQQQHHQPQHQHPQHQHQQHLVNVHQSGGAGTPQSYNTVVATTRGYVPHAGSDFHVPGQSYGAQAGGQVGGGGGNIGVSGARGPPSLGNIQSIGQTTSGIQSGSGASGNQQQPQVPTSGVQQQQQQQPPGPVPTTTPPIHTPSPQEMGKPVHHQTQPPSLQQSYLQNQARQVPQGFYQMGPRQMQSRNSAHRSHQGGGATHVVSMQSVGGSAGQPPTMYPHPGTLNVPGTPMYVTSQVPNIHTGPHQSPMYPVNNQMSQIAFTPQHRHQAHQSQHFFTSFPAHTILPPNLIPFPPTGPTTQLTAYCYPPTPHPSNTTMNLTRASANAVSGGATHVGGPLVGAQTNTGSQNTLQQPSQQPQTIPPMAISLTQSAYAGHNGGVANSLNTTYQKVTTRPNALMNIVDPATGKNVAEDIYRNAATPNDEPTGRPAPPSQDSAIAAEFASRVAKVANEGSETNSNLATSNIQENHQQLPSAQSNSSNQNVQSLPKSQSNSRENVPVDPQCNLIPPITTETAINSVQSPSESTYSSAPVIDVPSQSIVPESRTTSVTIKDVQTPCEKPYVDTPTVPPSFASCVKKDDDSTTQQSNIALSINTDEDSKLEPQLKDNPVSKEFQNMTAVNEIPTPISTSTELHSSKESFSTPKNSSRSQSKQRWRGKQQHQDQKSSSPVALPVNISAPEIVPTEVELEETKAGEKNHSSPTAQNHHINQKANVELPGDKPELETGAQADCPQTSTDEHRQRDLRSLKMSEWTNNGRGGASSNSRSTSRNRRGSRDHGKAMQKQKSKNKLRSRDLNRKGAEKEGTDMDAFVNPSLQSSKIDEKVQEHDSQSPSQTAGITTDVDQHEQPETQLEIPPQKVENAELSKIEGETIEIKPDVKPEEKLVEKSSPNEQSEKIMLKSSESAVKELAENNQSSLADETAVPVENHREMNKDSTLTIEDSNKCSQQLETKTKDVVDHVKISDAVDVEAVVAQKNEENTKVSSGYREFTDINSSVDNMTPVFDKHNENEQSNRNDSVPKAPAIQTLKYQYNTYQWSPQNTSGKREYDREFLMKLQDDPKSRIRPSNLPDLEVVLNCSRQISRSTIDMRKYNDTRAHEQLYPTFAKSSYSPKLPPPTKKSYQGKSKPSKPNVIHVSLSLREDIKLRETENAWKPTRLKDDGSDEDIKTQNLYRKVRSVLNKLTPQKFNTLVEQVRALEIDTLGRLEGVIDLVFEKAIDEPNFSVAYALMCKELSYMQVTSDKKTPQGSEVMPTFRKILISRCQMEFEKNAVDEMARLSKVQEMEQCTDNEKKKELLLNIEEENRNIRMRSVGNIRFIGELYKQEMLTAKIMHQCIKHLLQDTDEENLECLCKLLTTIGKIFDSKHDLSNYFTILSDLTNRKSNKKISSRVRFMIQDVIDLKKNGWIPRRDDSNPKTMDQIQKEADSERIESQFNNTQMNTPRKDDRNNDRRRNRGIGSIMNDGWSAPVGKTRQPSYPIEMSKLNTKATPMDEVKLGNRNAYLWKNTAPLVKPPTLTQDNKFAILDTTSLDQDKRPSLPLSGSRSTDARDYRSEYKSTWDGRGSRNGSHQMSSSTSNRDGSLMENSRSQSITMPPPPMKFKPPVPVPMTYTSTNVVQSTKPPKTEEQLKSLFTAIVDKSNFAPNDETFIQEALDTIHDNFDSSTFPLFVAAAMDTVLERTAQERKRFSLLLSHLIKNNMITLSLVQTQYEKIIQYGHELVIDVPMCWIYLAEILSEMVVIGTHPLSELKRTLAILKVKGTTGLLLGALLSKLAKDEGPKWVADKWSQSGLEWSDLFDNKDHIDMLEKYNLEFITNGCSSTEKSASSDSLTFEEIHDHLLKLMRDSDFDNITSWITANVGERSKQPQFVRNLMTASLEVSTEKHNTSWRLNSETFKNLLPLITRYVDAVPQLELQCLYAIQAHIHKLMHPQGVLGNVIDLLYDGGTISDDAYLTWQKSTDPAEVQGHAVAVKALTSFFVHLQETRDDSSEEA